MDLWRYELETPLGPMRAAFDGRGRLRELIYGTGDPRETVPLATKPIREAHVFFVRQLASYFAGTLRTFTVPLAPEANVGPPALRLYCYSDFVESPPKPPPRAEMAVL